MVFIVLIVGNLLVQISPLTECETSYGPVIKSNFREDYCMFYLPLLETIGKSILLIFWQSFMSSNGTPWYKDPIYCIGTLTKRMRKIRLINTLTKDEHILPVCCEESLSCIQDRYSKINIHAKGNIY